MSATKLKPVDVVVVGSGVVGSIMSMELASAGMSVVCLERGKQFEIDTDFQKPNVYDELKFDRHSDIFQNLARDTITFRNNDAQTALPMREMGAFKPGEMVGGTSAHWGGNARRFLPHDFEMYSRIKERYGASFIPEDCNLQDWGPARPVRSCSAPWTVPSGTPAVMATRSRSGAEARASTGYSRFPTSRPCMRVTQTVT